MSAKPQSPTAQTPPPTHPVELVHASVPVGLRGRNDARACAGVEGERGRGAGSRSRPCPPASGPPARSLAARSISRRAPTFPPPPPPVPKGAHVDGEGAVARQPLPGLVREQRLAVLFRRRRVLRHERRALVDLRGTRFARERGRATALATVTRFCRVGGRGSGFGARGASGCVGAPWKGRRAARAPRARRRQPGPAGGPDDRGSNGKPRPGNPAGIRALASATMVTFIKVERSVSRAAT
jgi:hypothetical protein